MREIMHDPRLGRIAGTLAGVDGIRIWHDQALFKPPFGNPTAWHLDNPYWSFSSRQSISIWIALEDATYQNGCMYYVPGTHKTARRQRRHRAEPRRAVQTLSRMDKHRHGGVSLPRRQRRLPQRPDGPRRGREHDQRPPPRHDLRLHARRRDLQRQPIRSARRLLRDAQGRRRAEQRRRSTRCSGRNRENDGHEPVQPRRRLGPAEAAPTAPAPPLRPELSCGRQHAGQDRAGGRRGGGGPGPGDRRGPGSADAGAGGGRRRGGPRRVAGD